MQFDIDITAFPLELEMLFFLDLVATFEAIIQGQQIQWLENQGLLANTTTIFWLLIPKDYALHSVA